MATHAMIDLETLGTSADCQVLTIGAVKFDPNDSNKKPYDEFYFHLNIDEQDERGRTVDPDTLEWWGKQDPEIIEEAFTESNRVDVTEMLTALRKWFVGVDTVWSQGSFDINILEHMFTQYNSAAPWPFWKVRDCRTLFSIMPTDPRKQMNFAAHNALEDCHAQAMCVQATLKQLGLTVK